MPGLPYPLPPRRPREAERLKPSPKSQAEGWFRTTIPATVMCFIFCMCCKVFLGDTFVLHTSSMEPTLIGRRTGGDRVVVSKLHAAFGNPSRFDVILFRYPNNETTQYLKRIVGLGGEQLFIRGGDLWIADRGFAGTLEEGRRSGKATIVKKPLETGEAFLDALPVIAEAELRDFDGETWRRHCEVVSGAPEAWRVEDGHVSVSVTGLGMARLRREVRDVITDAAEPAKRDRPAQPVAGGRNPVGDMSLRLDVRARTDSGTVILRIDDGVGRHVVTAEVAVRGGQGKTRVLIDGRSLGACDFALESGEWTRLRLDNVDDRVRLLANDAPVLVRDFGHEVAMKGSERSALACRAAFGMEDGAADLRPVSLHRDISYVADGKTRFLIPDEHYVVLGDNTGSSADSRSWKSVAIRLASTGEILRGDANGVTSTAAMLHASNPWMEPDGTWRFADRTGTIHSFDDRSEWTEVGSWPTPYVHRTQILGRGLCVLWGSGGGIDFPLSIRGQQIPKLDRFSWLR